MCNIDKDLEDGTIYDSLLDETVNQARKHSNTSHKLSAHVPLQYLRLKMQTSCLDCDSNLRCGLHVEKIQ